MLFIKNMLKPMIISITTLLALTFIITLFNYINLFNFKIVNIGAYIIPFISFFIGAILLGKKSITKGWLEGIKFAIIIIIISFIFNILAFGNTFSTKNIIFYFIILLASVIGSMIGINLKKN